MNAEQMTDLIRNALFVALEISAPLLIAMVIGLCISIFQSVTQINEMTLTFVPKMFVFAITLSLFFPWMLKIMTKYTLDILTYQWDKVINSKLC